MLPKPRSFRYTLLATFALFTLFAQPGQAADPERGRVLYETRCDVCHGTGVHVRQARKATTFDGIRAQVIRWDTALGPAWSREDIDDVTWHLNKRYYNFPCPDAVCGGGQAANSWRDAGVARPPGGL